MYPLRYAIGHDDLIPRGHYVTSSSNGVSKGSEKHKKDNVNLRISARVIRRLRRGGAYSRGGGGKGALIYFFPNRGLT